MQRVLMLVDIVAPGWVPWSQLTIATDVPGYIASYDQILAYDFEYFVGGPCGTTWQQDRYGEAVRIRARLVQQLQGNTRLDPDEQ